MHYLPGSLSSAGFIKFEVHKQKPIKLFLNNRDQAVPLEYHCLTLKFADRGMMLHFKLA